MTLTPTLSYKPFAVAMNAATHAGQVILFGVFAFMLVAALHPDVHSAVRNSLVKDYRMVVSTAHGDLMGDGTILTVAKVRTRDSLFLEIYQTKADGAERLLEKIELSDKRDGFFNFNGQATNLAIDDIDGDGKLEILVPSFDQNMVGHLNIYHYDSSIGTFARSLR